MIGSVKAMDKIMELDASSSPPSLKRQLEERLPSPPPKRLKLEGKTFFVFDQLLPVLCPDLQKHIFSQIPRPKLNSLSKAFYNFCEQHRPKKWLFNPANHLSFEREKDQPWVVEALQSLHSLSFTTLISKMRLSHYPDKESKNSVFTDEQSQDSVFTDEEIKKSVFMDEQSNEIIFTDEESKDSVFTDEKIERSITEEEIEEWVFFRKEDFQYLITNAPNLQELTIYDIPRIKDYMDFIFPQAPKLKSFGFSYDGMMYSQISSLEITFCTQFTALENLDIHAGMFFDKEKFSVEEEMSQFFSPLKTLKTLILRCIPCDDLEEDRATHLFKGLGKVLSDLKDLKTLTVIFKKETDFDALMLLAECNLTNLSVGFNDEAIHKSEDVYNYLRKDFNNLKTLAIENLANGQVFSGDPSHGKRI